MMDGKQYTLAKEFTHSGIGLHSGEMTCVRVLPASPHTGRYFVRVDLPGTPQIPARIEVVNQTMLSTELRQGETSVRTVEHLLAALMAMGVDDACIEIDGPEVPLLDGSGKLWADAIAGVGLALQNPETVALETSNAQAYLSEPIWIRQGDAFVAALPADELRFSYGIDFEEAAIGNQWYSWSPERESFATAIAPARTFGLARQIEQLLQAGLIKGGSLENALVCDASGWLNPPLRYANEPVRHKILDLVGDLSLLGQLPQAHYLAYKASHTLHVQLAKALSASEVAC